MTQYGTWVPYTGSDSILLASVLFIMVGFLVYLGIRLHRPLDVKRPGKANTVFMIIIWLLSIITFLFGISAYGLQLYQKNLIGTPPENLISPITYLSVLITFILIFVTTWKNGKVIAILSGAVAAMAAPMMFELPFDLIVMTRTYPAIPSSPILFRGLFFLPLFIIELSTISLLTLSPLMKIKKSTIFSLAGMFLVFAVWALFGFSYPSSLLPIVLNAISKVLCFITAITLFIPERWSPVPNQETAALKPFAGGY